MNRSYLDWLPHVLSVANAASKVIANIYDTKNYQIESKLDNSPITEADIKAHHLITEGLRAIDLSIPILSEEGDMVSFEERSQWTRFWLVDPLDGTREFIQETGEFTVNIALVEGQLPVMGVIVAPILQQRYWAVKGAGAYFQQGQEVVQPIHVHEAFRSPLKVAVSRRSHDTDKSEWINLKKRLGTYELVNCGSALKICLVAKGDVDLYPRAGATGEWDTAAGQCILEEAGGQLVDMQGTPLRYNTRHTLINPGFYAIGSSQLAAICCG